MEIADAAATAAAGQWDAAQPTADTRPNPAAQPSQAASNAAATGWDGAATPAPAAGAASGWDAAASGWNQGAANASGW